MSEISEKGRKLLDQYWDAVIGYERMSGYINYEKAEDMALDELSSYIAALEAEVAALKAERRWIPVGERLPELDQDVLAIVEGDIAIGHFYEEWGGDVYFSWVEVGAMQVATHWMPLPELPEATNDR